MTIPAIRTPQECFIKLSQQDFPYEPKYAENVAGTGLRVAYYDIPPFQRESNNNDDAVTFVCLHGEPSWSYLYRHMIPIFQQKGRVICIDLIGFGQSDKPTRREDYSYSLHRTLLLEILHQRLDLHNITLVVQDWGGVLGLSLPMEAPQRYSRILVMNTMLPIEPETYRMAMIVKEFLSNKNAPQSGFAQWLALSQQDGDLDVGSILQIGCYPCQLTQKDIDAYNAPFPTSQYKMGAKVFPTLVPLHKDMDGYAVGRQALYFYQHYWKKPIFMAIGARDRVIPPSAMKRLLKYLPTCDTPLVLPKGSHFVQEHFGAEIAQKALDYFDSLKAKDTTAAATTIMSKL